MPILVSDDAADINTSRVRLPTRETSRGRTLVIGDMHGCSTALDLILGELQPGRDDNLVTLGDYVVVHVGFAITRLDEASALETLSLFEQMGVLEEELGAQT